MAFIMRRNRSIAALALAPTLGCFSLAGQTLVDPSSPAAKYIYTFAGNPLLPFNSNSAGPPTTYSFGATGPIGPGNYDGSSLSSSQAVGLVHVTVELTPAGEWLFSEVVSTCCRSSYTLTPTVAQVPGTGISSFSSISFESTFQQPASGTVAGGTLTISPTYSISSPPNLGIASQSARPVPLFPTDGIALTLITDGTGFLPGATLEWNGTALATTYFSSTQLTALVPGGLIAVPGPVSIVVTNPGGTSSSPSAFQYRFSEIGIFRSTEVLQTGPGFVLDSFGTNNWMPFDSTFVFGEAGDMPVAGDFFGNGVVEMGVFRCVTGAATCQWYVDANNNGSWDGVSGGDALWNFGIPGDIPVVGDWTGDGTSKIGIFRCPAAGSTAPCLWVLDAGNNHTYDPATAVLAYYGLTGDLPVVSNWNGGTVDHVGIFRGNGLWIVDNLGLNTWLPSDSQYSYGLAGDKPVVGNWTGTARKNIGVFRPSGGYWVLNSSGSNSWSPSDTIGSFGVNGDLPVVGFWTQPVASIN
jgi:hypothetical protein